VEISHGIYERLTVDGSAAYAYNQLFPNTNQTIKNFTASSTPTYGLTRNITAELRYLFQNIDADTTTITYQFSRHEVGLMLSMEWK